MHLCAAGDNAVIAGDRADFGFCIRVAIRDILHSTQSTLEDHAVTGAAVDGFTSL